MSSQKEKTIMARDFTLAEAKRQYDKEAKNLLSYRCIIAYLLKYCTVEFSGFSLGEINRCLGGKGTELSGDGKIQHVNSKDNLPGLVPIEFDLRFNVVTPFGTILQLDLEPQKEKPSDAVLKNRGCYYCSRMISSQSNTVFEKDNYQDIQTVYSIWIVMDGGSRVNTIEKYVMQNVNNKDDVLSLVNLIYIYIGEAKQEGISVIQQLLDTIHSATTMTIEEIIVSLENQFQIRMTKEMKEVVTNMCNFSDAIEEKTLRKVASNLFAMHTPLEVIAQVLEITVEKVKELLDDKV